MAGGSNQLARLNPNHQSQGAALELSKSPRPSCCAILHQQSAQHGSDGISCFIRKVDKQIRQVKPDAYTPRHVSIGPYHRNAGLEGNEEKRGILNGILQEKALSGDPPRDPSTIKSEWLSELSNHRREAICFYEYDPDSFSATDIEEFLNMLLEDGCYILYKFVVKQRNDNTAGGSQEVAGPKVERDVLYLAENQIPFFILEKIDQMIGLSGKTSLVKEFCLYIEKLLEYHGYAIGKRHNNLTPDPSHLVHLLHILLIGYEAYQEATGDSSRQTEQTRDRRSSQFRRWRQAKQYEMARVDLTGVDLNSISERSRGGAGPPCPSRSILEVKLRRTCDMRFEFPRLYVDAETWCILRNLIALEQGNPKKIPHRVTAYCVLMSQLACTEKDVELLSERGVMDHLMGNHEACAKCFADLCSGVTFELDDPTLNYLRDECVELERRYRSRPSKWTAWMLKEYCRNPCVAVGSVIAIIFIVFALLQAVYTVLKLSRKVK